MDRRRRYYIDKKFQKRFLILFGAIAFLITVSNFLFYKFKVLKVIEEMIYKSHFVFKNLINYFEMEFLRFSLINAVIVLFIVIVVYTYFRIKIKIFFDKFESLIDILIDGKEEVECVEMPEEFEGISSTIKSLVKEINSTRKKQKALISQVEKIIQN